LSFPARAIYTGDIPFWGVYMSSIKMSDGFSVDCQPACAAVIDSGTSLMSLPSVVSAASYLSHISRTSPAELRGAKRSDPECVQMVYSLLDQIGNDYNADCSNVAAKLPNIVLTLEGQKFYLRPQVPPPGDRLGEGGGRGGICRGPISDCLLRRAAGLHGGGRL
jgi:hypothetical protein